VPSRISNWNTFQEATANRAVQDPEQEILQQHGNMPSGSGTGIGLSARIGHVIIIWFSSGLEVTWDTVQPLDVVAICYRTATGEQEVLVC